MKNQESLPVNWTNPATRRVPITVPPDRARGHRGRSSAKAMRPLTDCDYTSFESLDRARAGLKLAIFYPPFPHHPVPPTIPLASRLSNGARFLGEDSGV